LFGTLPGMRLDSGVHSFLFSRFRMESRLHYSLAKAFNEKENRHDA
jgi:hypothetical protein